MILRGVRHIRVSWRVVERPAGQHHALSGNGAGKTTLMRPLWPRSNQPRSASLRASRSTSFRRSSRSAQASCLCPEGRQLFSDLPWRKIEVGRVRSHAREHTHDAENVRLFPKLPSVVDRPLAVSGGEQQMLRWREGVSRPRLLMLNEPSSGCAGGDHVAIVQDHHRSETMVSRSSLSTECRRRYRAMPMPRSGRITLQGPGVTLANEPRIRAAIWYLMRRGLRPGRPPSAVKSCAFRACSMSRHTKSNPTTLRRSDDRGALGSEWHMSARTGAGSVRPREFA